MADELTLDVTTPTRKLVEGVKVSKLVLPGGKGQLELLPGHTHYLTTLETGIMSYPEGGTEKKFAISYGFAEVNNDKVVVLAETCEPAEEIDKARAAEAQQKAEQQLNSTLSDDHFRKYQMKLERALVRQQIAE